MDNKTENKSIKLAADVKEAVVNFDISKQLSLDKSYRNIAVISSVVLIVAVFFISLASANFDWNSVMKAQFWLDFSVTFFGAMFMKYIWGLSGNYEGNNNPKVMDALTEVEQANKALEDAGLLTELEDEVQFINNNNKIKQLRKQTFWWLSWLPKNAKYKAQKEAVIIYEEWLKSKDEKKKKDLEKKLDEMNFNLESFRIKIPTLKVEHLQMGFANGGNSAQDQFNFNMMQQLFGQQLWVTMASLVFTVLVAVISLVENEVTLATMSLFASRVFIYSINGFFGFTTGKSSVETVRYTVLKNISRFLKTFIEKMKGVK
jgi:hypothetical protein